jgi:hypothetical protein
MWIQSPLWGNGNEAYRVSSPTGQYSHCNYTELMANYGVLGTLLFYMPFTWGTITAWRMRKSVNPFVRRQALLGLICCLVLFAISVPNVVYYLKYIMLFYGLVLGRICYLKDNYQQLNRPNAVLSNRIRAR